MEDLNGTRSSFSTGWYHATMWRTSVAQPWIRAMLRWAQCSYSLTRSAPCHFKPLWRCLPWQLQNNQHVSYLKKKKIIIAKNEATINQSVQKCWYSKLMPIFFFFFSRSRVLSSRKRTRSEWAPHALKRADEISLSSNATTSQQRIHH